MKRPNRTREYQTKSMDTSRWEGFEPRDDDIIVCSSYKSGTTWMQAICAALIFQQEPWPDSLSGLSPWLDLKTRSIDEVRATYDSQLHRRFIKSHTPLDGLPWFDNVTYMFCGRDPRDVFVSMRNHQQNTDRDVRDRLLAEREDGSSSTPPAPAAAASPDEDFEKWLTVSTVPWHKDGFPFTSYLSHAQGFWDYRHLPNLHLLHFADLKADLEGQMRRLAGLLQIDVAESLWPGMIDAASFDTMKARADQYAPGADQGIWKDSSNFFNKGTSGQWREVLSPESLALYQEIKPDRLSPGLAEWIEQGSLVRGYPRELAG